MGRRIWLVLTVIAALSALSARAEDGATPAAKEALDAFTGAVASGEVDTIAEVLAPEFQIMRANGVGYDREGYLASRLPKIDEAMGWDYENVVTTTAGDRMVIRYILVISETIDNRSVERRAPRLTVFRRDGDQWLMVAHANFASIE